MNAVVLAGLREALGPEGLLLPDQDLSRYEREWRGRFASAALAVARPANLDQLAATVRRCAEYRLPMVPQGGNTGLVGGAVAVGARKQLIISLERMRQVRAVDGDNACLIAEAGCTLQQAQSAAAAAGFRLPLALASGGSATIGGVLATNAGGNETLRFGNARAMVLGLEAVFADGNIWSGLSSLRKDNAGYALAQLLVGSEGTLAIMSAASLALQPLPQQSETAWLAVDSPAAALALLRRLRKELGETLTAFELIPAQAMAFVLAHLDQAVCPLDPRAPWHVLLECDSSSAGEWLRSVLLKALGDALEAGEVADAVLATNAQQRRDFWRLRESISDAQKVGGLSLKHDISVPTAAIPGFIAVTLEELQALVPGIRPCVFGHLGDGNLHFNLSRPELMSDEAFKALEDEINQRVFARVLAAGGSIAAEHGIGLLRHELLAESADQTAYAAMRRIKQALDPLSVMNPGKVLRSD
ncbi:MAG: FAD-binding oxidoreductase [Wenzhouxiangella sp.]